MSQNGFRNFQQFRSEFLTRSAGALSSTVEDIADDIYRVQVAEETGDSLWDAYDDDDE